MKFWVALCGVQLFIFGGLLLGEQRGILTPQPPATPRVNGPAIFGVRVGNPFLYRIPATGSHPLTYFSKGLPKGLKLNRLSGVISGKLDRAGTYDVVLGAQNSSGRGEKKFQIAVGSQLALTPPMGWSTWYTSYENISDQMVRSQASAMVTTGLADHGYTYIDIDDGWNIKPKSKSTDDSPRDSNGKLKPGKAFPDMNKLTDYAHGQGLKIGIYISPGPLTCAEYEGSYQHERQDAETFSAWGFDLLKYDLCSYGDRFLSGPHDPAVKKPYQQMGDILKSLNRDVVYNLCEYGFGDVWEWGHEVGGHMWRTAGDLDREDYTLWQNVKDFGFGEAGMEKWARPGEWNDPDNLQLGQIMRKGKIQPTPLTHNEQYAHYTLWAMLAAPLVIGGDLTKMDEFTLGVLQNDEVIAVDQDVLGKQARPVTSSADVQVWAKELANGKVAVALFNLGEKETEIGVHWADLKIHGHRLVRDLWRQRDLGNQEDEFHLSVGEHGAELVMLSPLP